MTGTKTHIGPYHTCMCQLYFLVEAGVLIGTLPTEAHGVSGILYVHDDVTLLIEQFYYDGYAPGEPIFGGKKQTQKTLIS